jgi:hypothetical protein
MSREAARATRAAAAVDQESRFARFFAGEMLDWRLLDWRLSGGQLAETSAHSLHGLNLSEADRTIEVVLLELLSFRVRQSSLNVPLEPKLSWRSSAMVHMTLPTIMWLSGGFCDGGRTSSMTRRVALCLRWRTTSLLRPRRSAIAPGLSPSTRVKSKMSRSTRSSEEIARRARWLRSSSSTAWVEQERSGRSSGASMASVRCSERNGC